MINDFGIPGSSLCELQTSIDCCCGLMIPLLWTHSICTDWPTHNNDVIMSAMAPQITRDTTVYSTVCSGADQRKHQRKFPGNLWIPPQRASNAENVSIRWRHHSHRDANALAPNIRQDIRNNHVDLTMASVEWIICKNRYSFSSITQTPFKRGREVGQLFVTYVDGCVFPPR